ncbi:hypothetical protein CGRA01v4_03344 [Colletotrichum graminicola]|nr:hypothetical protein CGRA01v4_03344 [Colletotrichum graminicola]
MLKEHLARRNGDPVAPKELRSQTDGKFMAPIRGVVISCARDSMHELDVKTRIHSLALLITYN